jgi:hypothetical protein
MSGIIGEDVNNTSAVLPFQEPSRTTMYTIPQGTIVYHGSLTRETFNVHDIRLGNDKLIAMFSPSKRIAADYIVGCALYPTKPGFIHKFLVHKDIERIRILSPYERKDHWTLQYLEDAFCSRRADLQSNGVGFFFQKNDLDRFNDFTSVQAQQQGPTGTHEAEFALCNPSQHLTYIGTYRCVSMRRLGDLYKFNGTLQNVDPSQIATQLASQDRQIVDKQRKDSQNLGDGALLPPASGTSENIKGSTNL